MIPYFTWVHDSTFFNQIAIILIIIINNNSNNDILKSATHASLDVT